MARSFCALGELLPLAVVLKRLAALNLGETPVTTDASAFTKTVKKSLSEAGVDLTAPQLKALIAGLAERNDSAPIVADIKGKPVPDTDARDTENVPLSEDIHAYFAREVLPHVSDAWIDESKTKTGYEIPFTRPFYKYVPPRVHVRRSSRAGSGHRASRPI